MSLLKRLGMSLASFGLACAFNLEARLYAKDIYVPQDYATIQSAIDANDTVDGDRVLVAPGEYVIREPITYKGKNIILKSEEGADDTIIRLEDPNTFPWEPYRGVIMLINDETEAVLDGFTITGGRRADVGGGIYCENSAAYITNNIIIENIAKHGGGVGCKESEVVIYNNIISNNIGFFDGGGIYSHLSKIDVLDNHISNNSGYQAGGGIACYYKTIATIKGNKIIENYADEWGGGILFFGSEATIEDNIIAKNATMESGGGISSKGNMLLINNTITQNFGGVICIEGNPTILNSIIYANTPTDLLGIQPYQVFYSDIGDAGFDGNGNISEDPLFADPNSNNYHLKSQAGRYDPNSQTWVKDNVTSPCIDAGDPMSPIMYEPFPNGGRINMGAYGGTKEASKSYFGLPLCKTIVAGDINGDCKIDFKDFAIMVRHWLERGP